VLLIAEAAAAYDNDKELTDAVSTRHGQQSGCREAAAC